MIKMHSVTFAALTLPAVRAIRHVRMPECGNGRGTHQPFLGDEQVHVDDSMPRDHVVEAVCGAIQRMEGPPQEPKPIQMLIHCPICAHRHIDEDKWATRPHHTHACQHCGHVWRPCVQQTVGVKYLPGYKNL